MPSTGPALPDTTIRTPIAVEGWLRNAVKGERLEYWRGDLASAIYDEGRPLKERFAIRDLGDFMRELEADGAVVLCQRRHGAMDYSYYAVKA